MDGKKKKSLEGSDYLYLYQDLTSKMIDLMLPNLNSNTTFDFGKKNALQVFTQYEVAYIVENLRGVEEQMAWSFVPSLVRNIKMNDYAKIHCGQRVPTDLDQLLKKVNVELETNLDGANKFSDLDEIVKVVLLMTAILKKIEESNTPKVVIINEDVRTVKESIDFNKYDTEECNASNSTDENLDGDFKVQNCPLSQSTVGFLQSGKDKKDKRKRTVSSVDSALDGIIDEVHTSMARVKNISENMSLLKIVDRTAVFEKAQELRNELETIKMQCDEFVTKFLDNELMRRIDEDETIRDGNAVKPDELLAKHKGDGDQLESAPRSEDVELVSPEIKTSELISLSTTSEIKDGSGDTTPQSKELPLPATKQPATKSKAACFSKLKSPDKSSSDSVAPEILARDDVSILIRKTLKKRGNLIHILVESDLSKNMVYCTPCNVDFKVTHLNMSEHILTSQHLDKLRAYYLDLQRRLLETYPDILQTFQLPPGALWDEMIFIDPSQKLAYCVCCRITLQYQSKVILIHMSSKTHISEVFCVRNPTLRKVNMQDERMCSYLRGNRIINAPFDTDTLNCIPCDAELTNVLFDVVRHAQSGKHQNTLNEYNYKVQKEIIKSNADLFGFGKQYPLTEKHLLEDKLFLNPVADFAYCGICRKLVVLNDIKNKIMAHLTHEQHVINFELSRQFCDSFVEVSEARQEAKLPELKAGTPMVQSNDSNKMTIVKSQVLAGPSAVKRRYDELDSLSQENLPSHLWYIPLEQWIKADGGTDASGQSALTLSEIVKMKDDAFKNYTGLKEIKTNTQHSSAFSPSEKKALREVKRISLINRLTRSSSNQLRCLACCVAVPNDLASVSKHVSGIPHIVNLRQFNIKQQKVNIKRYPKDFSRDSPFYMSHSLIHKDTIFIDPGKKVVYCSCCTVVLKYSRNSIDAHIAGKSHLNLRSKCIDYLKTMGKDGDYPIQENTDETQGKSVSFDKRLSESNSLEVEESPNENDEAKSSNDANSDEVSRSSSVSEISEASAVGADGTMTCWTCDIRDIPNKKCFEAHLRGKTHNDNLKLSMDPKSVNAKERILLSQNMISSLYGHVPLMYTCNACKCTNFTSIKTALNHAKSANHIKALEGAQSKTSSKTNADSLSGQIADAEDVNKQEKEHCKNADSNNQTNKGNEASVISYGMDSRPLKDKNIQNPHQIHIPIFIIRVRNKYRCVNCDYDGIVSIPMAYAHLRSCFHNPVIVEGVQYLKEANYHCIVCTVKLYGIKDVVNHIGSVKHFNKLENYYK